MAGHIIVTDEGATRTIVMRRPEKKNALTPEMFLAMSEAINSAQSNPDIRCLILAGRSGVFTAGDDVGDFVEEATIKREAAQPRNSVAFVRSLITNRKPIIAAVDGIAVGMGVTMVLHCDYVIASTTASFSVALHSVWPGAGRRLEPAAAENGRPSARILASGDGPADERGGSARSRFRQ